MKVYLVHCGFYDAALCDGIYESHVNFFVAAENFEDARLKAKQLADFKSKRMHVDGLQEINAVDGYRIELKQDAALNGESLIGTHKHRDLAPKPQNSSVTGETK
jgi:hypothetical protein